MRLEFVKKSSEEQSYKEYFTGIRMKEGSVHKK
jgi:hypothetical protein